MILPPDEAATINGDLTAAVKEAEKEKPDSKKIQSRFQGVLDTIKEVGNTIETVSKWGVTKNLQYTGQNRQKALRRKRTPRRRNPHSSACEEFSFVCRYLFCAA